MGIREIKYLEIILLLKQRWRLLKNNFHTHTRTHHFSEENANFVLIWLNTCVKWDCFSLQIGAASEFPTGWRVMFKKKASVVTLPASPPRIRHVSASSPGWSHILDTAAFTPHCCLFASIPSQRFSRCWCTLACCNTDSVTHFCGVTRSK